ncbi:MAG: response regulator [Bacteroidia bacterium]|nr:response regulator [Bacteroidales bacterium]NCD42084.1 response regulator [Bacteroidia bacterium]MDD2323549.1 response regulator [Bacteroidales bacterium]MDD3010961.1 response regulator [Bacteroidales bacterium]MDD3960245.1 response regulator [Bacteroidales bacterium]
MPKILLIDDDRALSQTTQVFLKAKGFDVTVAENGAVGIQKAFDVLPDLILCDINMPHIDGYEVFSVLQESSATNNIPFIFLTSKDDIKDIRTGMQLGADDYLTKPVNSEELYLSVQTRLKKHEKIIHANEEKFRTLLENNPNGVFILQEEKFVSVNRVMVNMFDFYKEEFENMSFMDIVDIDHRDYVKEKLMRCHKGFEKNIHIEFTALNRRKDPFPVELYAGASKIRGKINVVGTMVKQNSANSSPGNSLNLSTSEIETLRIALESSEASDISVSKNLVAKLIKVYSNDHSAKTNHTDEPAFTLSKRESEILEHICKGASTQEIAETLFISERTVEKHRANILLKSEMKNMVEVIIYAIKNKMVEI